MRYCLLLLILFSASAVFAQENDFQFGVYERVRQEYRKSAIDLENSTGKNYDYFRFKTSLWGKYDFSQDLSLYARLTNENRAYVVPSTKYDVCEFVFENLYLDVKDAFDLPLDLRLGRQNLIYGEGFIMAEGTPLDGSRTIYFNAAKATLKLEDWDLDFLGMRQDPKERRLPVINENNRSLVSQKEEALGLYGKYKGSDDFCFEPYYFYKLEKSAPKTKLHTLGAHSVWNKNSWKIRTEAAYQFGDYGSSDRRGIGGYLFFDYKLKEDGCKPMLTFGGAYLSGDDPDTDTNESWDPLFSHIPWLNELYSYMLTGEKEIGYWSNTQAYQLALTVQPTEKLCIKPAICYFRADENTFGGSSGYSNSGKERGWSPQMFVTYKFNDNIQGHILAEYFDLGDYYAETKDNPFLFRWQLEFKY